MLDTKRFGASWTIDSKNRHLGMFGSALEAALCVARHLGAEGSAAAAAAAAPRAPPKPNQASRAVDGGGATEEFSPHDSLARHRREENFTTKLPRTTLV